MDYSKDIPPFSIWHTFILQQTSAFCSATIMYSVLPFSFPHIHQQPSAIVLQSYSFALFTRNHKAKKSRQHSLLCSHVQYLCRGSSWLLQQFDGMYLCGFMEWTSKLSASQHCHHSCILKLYAAPRYIKGHFSIKGQVQIFSNTS